MNVEELTKLCQFRATMRFPWRCRHLQGAHLFEHLLARWLVREGAIVLSAATRRSSIELIFLAERLPAMLSDADVLWAEVVSLLEDPDIVELERNTLIAEQECLSRDFRADWSALDPAQSFREFSETARRSRWQIEATRYFADDSPVFAPLPVDEESDRRAQKLLDEVENFLDGGDPPPIWNKMVQRFQSATLAFPALAIGDRERWPIDVVTNAVSLFGSCFQDRLRSGEPPLYSVKLAHVPVVSRCVLLVFFDPPPEDARQFLKPLQRALFPVSSEHIAGTLRDGKILSLKSLERQLRQPRQHALLSNMLRRYGRVETDEWNTAIWDVDSEAVTTGLKKLQQLLCEELWSEAPRELQLAL